LSKLSIQSAKTILKNAYRAVGFNLTPRSINLSAAAVHFLGFFPSETEDVDAGVPATVVDVVPVTMVSMVVVPAAMVSVGFVGVVLVTMVSMGIVPAGVGADSMGIVPASVVDVVPVVIVPAGVIPVIMVGAVSVNTVGVVPVAMVSMSIVQVTMVSVGVVPVGVGADSTGIVPASVVDVIPDSMGVAMVSVDCAGTIFATVGGTESVVDKDILERGLLICGQKVSVCQRRSEQQTLILGVGLFHCTAGVSATLIFFTVRSSLPFDFCLFVLAGGLSLLLLPSLSLLLSTSLSLSLLPLSSLSLTSCSCLILTLKAFLFFLCLLQDE
jgi:hypothetical protein